MTNSSVMFRPAFYRAIANGTKHFSRRRFPRRRTHVYHVRHRAGVEPARSRLIGRAHLLEIFQADREALEGIAIADVLLDEQMLDARLFARAQNRRPVQ